MTAANAHSLFNGCQDPPCYLSAIGLSHGLEDRLRRADQSIRQRIREGFNNLKPYQKDNNLFINDDAYRIVMKEARARGKSVPALKVKFLLQGSTAYHTAVVPFYPPDQQADRDVGVYIVMDLLTDDEPLIASARLFETIEDILRPLCRERGWTLIDGDHPNAKSSCVRIIIGEDAHIDLPLYAIPRDEYEKIEVALNRAKTFQGMDSLSESLAHDGVSGVRLDHDQVQLAHRREGWIVSDPRLIQDWVEAQVVRYGPVFRRLCKYLKGWRNETWKDCGGPSSIILMVCVATVLRDLYGRSYESRDDALELAISERLPELFSGEIENPNPPRGERIVLNNDWSDSDRRNFINQARQLNAKLAAAIERPSTRVQIVTHLQSAHGERMPYAPEKVVLQTTNTASVGSLAAKRALNPATSSISG